MEGFLHSHQLVAFALEHLRNRNTRPLGHHFGDFLIGHAVTQQLHLHHFRLARHIQLALQLRNPAVLQLRHAPEIAGTAGIFQVDPGLFQLALDLLGTMQCRFFGIPDLFQVRVLTLDTRDDIRELRKPLLGGGIGFLFQRLPLYFQLDQTPLKAIQRFWLGVHLHADLACSLIHQINGLVRQLTVSDVTMRQLGRCDDGTVCDFHAVMNFVALLQAAEDRYGVLLGRLGDQYLLEPTLKGRVFLNILAILVKGGGAHAM